MSPARYFSDSFDSVSRSDLDTLLAGVLDEGAPTAADLKHMVARLHADGLDRDVHLAGHRVFDRLVVIGKDTLGVAPVAFVEEGQEELGVFVVMVRDRPPVALLTSADQGRNEIRDPCDRMEVAEERAHLERGGEIAVHVQPTVEIGDGDAELIQAAERLGASSVLDPDGERRIALPNVCAAPLVSATAKAIDGCDAKNAW